MRVVPILSALCMLTPMLSASERVFSYVEQSTVAPVGAKEVEVWSTYRRGHAGESFARQDNRLELEVGIVEGVQTAIYLNQTRITVDGISETESSISWEWKWQLSDPAADSFGSALYTEATVGSDEMSLEAKYIIDKQLGANDVIAAHVQLEPEWHTAPGDFALVEWETVLASGWSHRIGQHWRAGLELRLATDIEEETAANGSSEWEVASSALFLGPNIHAQFGTFWFTGTVLPQIYAFEGATGDDQRDLTHQERVQIRFIAGINF